MGYAGDCVRTSGVDWVVLVFHNEDRCGLGEGRLTSSPRINPGDSLRRRRKLPGSRRLAVYDCIRIFVLQPLRRLFIRSRKPCGAAFRLAVHRSHDTRRAASRKSVYIGSHARVFTKGETVYPGTGFRTIPLSRYYSSILYIGVKKWKYAPAGTRVPPRV
jgi:hypothetical protein